MSVLRAGWAVRGKPPGSYHDYEITGHGGAGFTAADYAHVLRHYALGTPPPERTGPAALPWVTVSEVRGPGGEARIGLAIEDWTEHADGAGRPIAETRYLCVPFEELTGAPASYTDLYRRLSAMAPPRDGGELVLEVPPLDPHRHAASLGRIGTKRAATAAALLLDGPVTVTGALELSVAQRLEFLDTVAALLPYGWRTRFSAATWDQNGNRNVSLAFARQVRPRTTELDWREPRLPPAGSEGNRYVRKLSELFGERQRPPADVIAHLARHVDSCANAEPGEAVRILGTLDWPVTVLRAVERGEPDVGAVRELLGGGRFRELPQADRRTVLSALIHEGHAGDVELLRECWAQAAGTAERPWRDLCATARRLLWGEDATAEPEGYFALAGDLGRADALLAVLVAPARRGEHPGGAERAGPLALRRLDPERPDWPKTLAELGRSPAVTCAILSQVAHVPRRRSWLAALDRDQPATLLHPFSDVLGPLGGRVDADRIGELAGHGPECVPALLGAAFRAGRLGLVLPGLAAWLTTAGEPLPAKHRTALGDRLTRLRPASPGDRGELDGLLLWLGLPPDHPPEAAADLSRYLEGFLPHWRREVPGGRADRRRDTLAAWLRQGGWATSHAEPVVLLVERLTAGLPEEGYALVRALVAVRAHAPGLEHLEFYRAWWQRASSAFPKLERESTMIVLAELPPDAPAEQVGRLCAAELWRGATSDRVAVMLLRSRPGVSGDLLVAILDETRAALAGFGSPTPSRQTVALAASLMKASDPYLRQALRKRITTTAVAEIEFSLRLIGVAADAEEENLLAEEHRSRLRDIAEWAQSLARPARQGFLGLGRRP